MLQVIIFIVAMTFYLLVTKSFCGKGLSDARVSIILISIIGLNAICTIVLLLAGVEGEATVIAASIATCVEQVTLLIMLMSYTKTRGALCRIFSKTGYVIVHTHTEREVGIQQSAVGLAVIPSVVHTSYKSGYIMIHLSILVYYKCNVLINRYLEWVIVSNYCYGCAQSYQHVTCILSVASYLSVETYIC